LPPDSLTVDAERLYWASERTPFITSVDKRTGHDAVSHVTGGSVNNLLSFADYLQPLPGDTFTVSLLFVTFASDSC